MSLNEPNTKGRFLLAERLSHQPSYQINKKVKWAAMAGMLDFQDIFFNWSLAVTMIECLHNESISNSSNSLLFMFLVTSCMPNCIISQRALGGSSPRSLKNLPNKALITSALHHGYQHCPPLYSFPAILLAHWGLSVVWTHKTKPYCPPARATNSAITLCG